MGKKGKAKKYSNLRCRDETKSQQQQQQQPWQDATTLKIDAGLGVQIQPPEINLLCNSTIHENGVRLEVNQSRDRLRILQRPEIDDCGALMVYDFRMAQADIRIEEQTIQKELSIISIRLREKVIPQILNQDGSTPTDPVVFTVTRNWCTIPFKDLAPTTVVRITIEKRDDAARELIELLQPKLTETENCHTNLDLLVTDDVQTVSGASRKSSTITGVSASIHQTTSQFSSGQTNSASPVSEMQANMVDAATETPVKTEQVWCDFTNAGRERPPWSTSNNDGKFYSRRRNIGEKKVLDHQKTSDRRRANEESALRKCPSARKTIDAQRRWQLFASDPGHVTEDQASVNLSQDVSIDDHHRRVKEAWSDKAKATRYRPQITPIRPYDQSNPRGKSEPQSGRTNIVRSEHVNIVSHSSTKPCSPPPSRPSPSSDIEFSGVTTQPGFENTGLASLNGADHHDFFSTKASGGAKFCPILRPINLKDLAR